MKVTNGDSSSHSKHAAHKKNCHKMLWFFFRTEAQKQMNKFQRTILIITLNTWVYMNMQNSSSNNLRTFLMPEWKKSYFYVLTTFFHFLFIYYYHVTKDVEEFSDLSISKFLQCLTLLPLPEWLLHYHLRHASITIWDLIKNKKLWVVCYSHPLF